MEIAELIIWIAGAFGAVFLLFCALWWRIEDKQDKKLDRFIDTNHSAHIDLHDKIDETQKQLNQDHRHLLGKIEEIWKALHPPQKKQATK